ncbi:protein kinase domain-containing protein [Actinomycetospora sp. TBRC 11914]|uniref:protein kinase domain-containing protein n=1 Tax=Actinomycetospora sp. TBRC 11914 TaxID=2729387 RepID=UPI00145F4EF3|nr:protein kinase [Actinomycetospora sp. TBRC 11914]NMO93340.1 serine/threonine protein kinase [Actinomycetospora sp. TBRC 11914]
MARDAPGAPASGPAASGTVLDGRYRVGEVLARGGMSTVHRGTDTRLDRPVAIKIMEPSLASDPTFVRRFEREARAAARLSHPGIVAVHDQGRHEDGTVFLVLELVEGGTLRDVIREQVRLAPATALTVVETVLAALRVAHRQGLVHRDVKPENVLVSRSGQLKVADFGLVAAAWDGAADGSLDTGGSTSDDLILGTAAYLAPEQVQSGRTDERSDVYAAGIVLYELLTGVPPHGGDTALAVAYRHVNVDVPAPSTRAPGIPRALDRLVLAATARDPDERLASAAAFLEEARRARREDSLPFSPVTPPRRPRVGAAAPPPRTGTRRFTGPTPRRAAEEEAPPPREEPEEPEDLDEAGPEPDDEPDDDRPRDGAARGHVDGVGDRVERHARRRDRIRSRRIFAAWVVLVGAATTAAGFAGWFLGAGGP